MVFQPTLCPNMRLKIIVTYFLIFFKKVHFQPDISGFETKQTRYIWF